LGFALQSSNFNAVFANLVENKILFRSAYYLDTIDFGVRFRKKGDTVWKGDQSIKTGTSLPAQAQVDSFFTFNAGLQRFTVYEYQVWITNQEGTYPSLTSEFETGDFIEMPAFYRRASGCGSNGSIINTYMLQTAFEKLETLTPTAVSDQIFAYRDLKLTQELETGWYTDGRSDSWYYQQGNGFTQLVVCGVTPPVYLFRVELFENGYYTWNAGSTFPPTPNIFTITVNFKQGSSIVGTFSFQVDQSQGRSGDGYHSVMQSIIDSSVAEGSMSPANPSVTVEVGSAS
jgi:hypothetical protein